MQGGCISGKVLRQQLRLQQLRLQQPEGSGLGDMLPSEEHHHTSRDEEEFVCQEVDSGDRLRFLGEWVCQESFERGRGAAPQ